MNKNVRIAKELVKIAKELTSAVVHLSVDFSEDEKLLKSWCEHDYYCPFKFSSDNGAVERTFTLSSPYGDINICSDFLEKDKVIYDVHYLSECEEFSSMEDAVNALSDISSCIYENKLNELKSHIAAKLNCDEISVDVVGYAFEEPTIEGYFKNHNFKFYFGYSVQQGNHWGYCIYRIDNDNKMVGDEYEYFDYSFDTAEKTLDAFVSAAKAVDSKK